MSPAGEVRLNVRGMSCSHCEATVEKALAAVPGVTRVVEVDRERERATVVGEVEGAALVAAVQEKGYEAELVS